MNTELISWGQTDVTHTKLLPANPCLTLDLLSLELLIRIFSYLQAPQDIANFAHSCKIFRIITEDKSVSMNIFRSIKAIPFIQNFAITETNLPNVNKGDSRYLIKKKSPRKMVLRQDGFRICIFQKCLSDSSADLYSVYGKINHVNSKQDLFFFIIKDPDFKANTDVSNPLTFELVTIPTLPFLPFPLVSSTATTPRIVEKKGNLTICDISNVLMDMKFNIDPDHEEKNYLAIRLAMRGWIYFSPLKKKYQNSVFKKCAIQ